VYVAALERLRSVYSADGAFTPAGVALSYKVTAASDATVRDAAGNIRLDQAWTNAYVEKVPTR
jgi:hypothetical protein